MCVRVCICIICMQNVHVRTLVFVCYVYVDSTCAYACVCYVNVDCTCMYVCLDAHASMCNYV